MLSKHQTRKAEAHVRKGYQKATKPTYLCGCASSYSSQADCSRIAAVGFFVMIPTFYLLQGTFGTGQKPVGEGQATIKEIRREKGTQNEYRDPRDSGKKTTEADRR